MKIKLFEEFFKGLDDSSAKAFNSSLKKAFQAEGMNVRIRIINSYKFPRCYVQVVPDKPFSNEFRLRVFDASGHDRESLYNPDDVSYGNINENNISVSVAIWKKVFDGETKNESALSDTVKEVNALDKFFMNTKNDEARSEWEEFADDELSAVSPDNNWAYLEKELGDLSHVVEFGENLLKKHGLEAEFRKANENEDIQEEQTEGFKAYRIPDDKREEYFEFKDKLDTAAPRQVNDSGWDSYSDPIIIINDMTVFSQQNQIAITSFMKKIGAKDVTEMYENESELMEKKKLTKAARKFISDKIKVLTDEGRPSKQAQAMAYSYARKEGFDVDESVLLNYMKLLSEALTEKTEKTMESNLETGKVYKVFDKSKGNTILYSAARYDGKDKEGHKFALVNRPTESFVHIKDLDDFAFTPSFWKKK